MAKIIFISNRLPVTVSRNDDDSGQNSLQFSASIGGLATGMKSVHEEGSSLWIGWCGLTREELGEDEIPQIKTKLRDAYHSFPVFLSKEEIDEYYYGFCNHTIWPLFHYFTNHARYNHEQWETYQNVNRKFFEAVREFIEPDDTVWIHDYQLFLLPEMIRKNFPGTKIGFFLHIPFPSYEIFRLLPWRTEILNGVLGADLIGFHTYDYVRHFLSSARRLLGFEHNLGYINVGSRMVKADVFPMGIDYERYHNAQDETSIQEETAEIMKKVRGTQIVLSVDRLDYTKGIPERIKAFAEFLRETPEYREKVTLILIVAPSRIEVDTYHKLLKEIQELVSDTNGELGSIGWVPVWFFFRSFGFHSLTALYTIADVLLVTPLRDGMNLVAKEYVAARADKKGMLVISETAGAVSELGEAVLVNANNVRQVAAGIRRALEMPAVEKIAKNSVMDERLAHYNVEFWAQDFLSRLNTVRDEQREQALEHLSEDNTKTIVGMARSATNRLFLLDYDGTIKAFTKNPEEAAPDDELRQIISDLAHRPENHVLITSSRDRHILEAWFADIPVSLAASHGMWIRDHEQENPAWELIEELGNDWKDTIRPVLELHAARTPGSRIEEKDYSLAWHYRRCEPELAAVRVSELKEALADLTANLNIGLLHGNKVIEIRDTTVNKGRAASLWLHQAPRDFIFAAGDDGTDEEMFAILPDAAVSIKVGVGMSGARYRADSVEEIRTLLKQF